MRGVLQTFNNISYSKEKQPDGRIKLEIEVQNSRFEAKKDRVYERLAPTVQVEGFRPGKAPKNVITARLGPTLYEQTLNELVPECTLEIIRKENLMPLDQIAYRIEKVAEGSGVKYSATFSVFPEFNLPDFKKLKVKREEVTVKDDEVETVIKQMHSESAEKSGKSASIKTSDSVKTTLDKTASKKVKMDDEWAKGLNLQVNNLKELEEKIRQELERQKKMMEENKFISQVLEKIVEKSKFEIPQVMVDQEISRQEEAYKKRIENLGMKLEDFLRNQKTSLDELKKGWKEDAEKRLKGEIIMIKVANEYKLKVENNEVDKYINSIKDEKLRSQYQNSQAKNYIKSVLIRQKVVDKLKELIG